MMIFLIIVIVDGSLVTNSNRLATNENNTKKQK